MGLRDLHRSGTMLLSVVMVIIGVALLVEAAAGVGGLSVRLLAGVLFVAAGVGRLYVETRRGAGGETGRRGSGRSDPGAAPDGRANGAADLHPNGGADRRADSATNGRGGGSAKGRPAGGPRRRPRR